jgi:hypothetical protein
MNQSSQTPYRGLIPFHDSDHDAQFFFGREEICDYIINNMKAFRLTLVYGASGVGKSSVLHAGIVYQLRKLADETLRKGRKPEICPIAFNNWSNDPVTGLQNAVQEAVARIFPDAQLSPPAQTLSLTLEHWADDLDCDLFIVLDQFEEYLINYAHQGAVDFAREFARAVNNRVLRASFLISMREDSLGKLELLQRFMPNVFEHQVPVPPLRRDEARRAIVGPLERYTEINNARGEVVSIEPELVEKVLDDIQGISFGSPSDVVIEAPYLQQVMTRLWELDGATGRLKLSSYQRLGGGKEIIRSHLSRILDKLTQEQRHLAAKIFRYLVTPGGTKVAMTAADLAAYVDEANISLEKITALLELLSQSQMRIVRVVTPSPDSEQAIRYEIFHDVLSAPINIWRIQQEEEERRRKRVAQERARFLRIGLGVAVVLLIAMMGLTAYAFQQQRLALQERSAARAAEQKAVEARNEAERQKLVALGSRNEAERQKDLVEEARKKLQVALITAEKNFKDAETAKAREETERKRAESSLAAARKAENEALRQKAAAEAATETLTKLNDQLSKEVAKRRKAEDDATLAAQAAENEKNLAVAAAETAKRAQKEADHRRLETERAQNRVRQVDQLTPFFGGIMRGYGSQSDNAVDNSPSFHARNAAFSPDGKFVVTAGDNGRIIVWKAVGTQEKLAELNDLTITAANPSPYHETVASFGRTSRGEYLIVANANAPNGVRSAVQIWKMSDDMKKGEVIHHLMGHNKQISGIALSADAETLVTGSLDGTVRVWDLSKCWTAESCQSELLPNDLFFLSGLTSVAISRDKRLVGASGSDGVAVIWDLVNRDSNGKSKSFRLSKRNGDVVNSITFSVNANMVLTASQDGASRVWKISGDKLATMHDRWSLAIKNKRGFWPFDFDWRRRRRLAMTAAAFTPPLPGQKSAPEFVVTTSEDGKVRLWDWSTATVVREFNAHIGVVSSADFSPDGRFIVTAGQDGTARIWEPCKDVGHDTTKMGPHNARERLRAYCQQLRPEIP